MAAIDTSKSYVLTNAYTQSERNLAVSSDSSAVIMQPPTAASTSYSPSSSSSTTTSPYSEAEVPTNQQWFLTTTSLPPYYRLHTVSGGPDLALDLINDGATNGIRLRMVATGSATGQYWRFDAWDGGADFRLTNNFTGLDRHLDVYSDTFEPHLAAGDLSGQHWTLTEVGVVGGGGSATSTSSATTAPTASGTTTAVPDVAPAAVLTTGAIAGIAGGSVALLLLAGLVLFFLLRRRKRQQQQPRRRGGAARGLGWYGGQEAGQEKGSAVSLAELGSPPAYQAYKARDGDLYGPDLHSRPHHHAELGGGDYQTFLAELPAPSVSELADTASMRSELADTGRPPHVNFI